MTGVEVLAPVRLETRFVPPERREDGVAQWLLRVRIYPDEFSVARTVAPPAPAELDRLSEALAAMSADPPLTERDAFVAFASAVGPARGLTLWRRCVVSGPDGVLTVDRSAQVETEHLRVHGPAGLPDRLEVWLVHTDGTRELARTLTPDRAAIAADLDLQAVFTADVLAAGDLRETWWLSYPRAVDVGLAVDLDVGPVPPQLAALVVVGLGDIDAAELVDAHNAGGRLAVLAPGTPTNTVQGEATTDLGGDAETLYPLLHLDPAAQRSTRVVLTALTGRVPPAAVPVLGGDLDWFGPGSLAVQGFWPTLWGRTLRDVLHAGDLELGLAWWARTHLAVEGPQPAIRVGGQPYGLLPTSAFGAWVHDTPLDLGVDPATLDLERRILTWALPWRAGAAEAARQATSSVHGTDTRGLVGALGLHAPSRRWRVRPIDDLAVIQTARLLSGRPPLPLSDADRAAAQAWAELPSAPSPIGPAARSGPLPGPPHDEEEDPSLLAELIHLHPESLYYGEFPHLGLVGHLFRASLIAARAVIGEASHRLLAGDPVELGRPLPLDDEDTYVNYVMAGDDTAADQLEASGDENARLLVVALRRVQDALTVTADLWDRIGPQLFRATLAALDTAAFRVDPWLTGLADRRLQRLVAAGAPFRLGAYGWVDAPAPFDAAAGREALAPGPTAAGLLHAPSYAQALTSALLRDAAVRYPGDDRWRLTLDSAKIRASVALAERVRLGVHPYEALGLEVEKLAGDWDTVRLLRRHYALAPDQQERRVCDGAAVLKAAREGTLVAALPADLAARLVPLDDLLDTYADLLLADGIHALVSGRADLAHAAMEAAAGLGPPADLRALRTPRAATTVRVAAWALLEPGPDVGDGAPDPDAALVSVADPAFAALITAGAGEVGGAPEATALAQLLGGGEDDGPSPTLIGGDYEGLPASADDDLRAAVAADLAARLATVRAHATAAFDAVAALDPADPGTPAAVADAAARWRVDVGTGAAAGDDEPDGDEADEARSRLLDVLAVRLTDTAEVAATDAAGARAGVRALVGRPDLPVLPVVDRALLPVLREVPELDRTWLELVAAVHPRLAALEARQLTAPLLGATPWPGAVAAPDGAAGAAPDPWHVAGPVLVAYGPAVPGVVAGEAARVAVATLDAWSDSVPSRRHATTAAFGFNAPKSRAPQAVLLAVPPDPEQRLTAGGLLDVVLETRELAHARSARPTDRAGLPYATPSALVHASGPASFLQGWPT